MTLDELKNISSRAAWTAAQAFLAVLSLSDMETIKAAAIAGVAAAISVVKTYVAQKVRSSEGGGE